MFANPNVRLLGVVFDPIADQLQELHQQWHQLAVAHLLGWQRHLLILLLSGGNIVVANEQIHVQIEHIGHAGHVSVPKVGHE